MDTNTATPTPPPESAPAGSDDDRENKQKRNIILAALLSVSITAMAGGALWYFSETNRPKEAKEGNYFNSEQNGAQQASNGQALFKIEPNSILLTKNESGEIKAEFIVSANNQGFTISRMAIEGLQGATLTSTCPIIDPTGMPTQMQQGDRCPIVLTYDPTVPNAGTTSPSPIVKINTMTKGPSGNDFAGSYVVQIKVDPASGIGPTSLGGPAGITSGAANTGGLPIGSPGTGGPGGANPYGDPNQNPALAAANGTNPALANSAVGAGAAPGTTPGTVPYADPYGGAYGTVPATSGGYGNAGYGAGQPQQMSPRQQLVQARRQPALAQAVQIAPGVVARASANKNPGSAANWDELDIPKTRSSMPVDTTRIVTMDRVITAVLARPIDSRNPTQVVAQVDRNVYGSSGRTILIPRGSMIIGTPAGSGAERLAISWTQIIRPDGARFVFQAASADANGMGGVPGFVNQRNGKRYGAILMGTAINAAIAVLGNAQQSAVVGPAGTAVTQNNGQIISDIVRQDLQRVTQDIVQRNQQLQTIITVPSGTRITIVPTQDLHMAPTGGYTQPPPRPQTNAQPRQVSTGINPGNAEVNATDPNPYSSLYQGANVDPSDPSLTAPSPPPAPISNTTAAPPPYPLRDQSNIPSAAIPSWVDNQVQTRPNQ